MWVIKQSMTKSVFKITSYGLICILSVSLYLVIKYVWYSVIMSMYFRDVFCVYGP